MLYEELIMGTNATRDHQRVIRRLIVGLANLYDQHLIKLEPLSETMLDEDKTSATPDVILLDNQTEQTIVIIEVAKTSGAKSDFKKIIKLIDSDEYDYGVEEGFVYNYKTNEWLKYQKGFGEIKENPSYCKAINYDLAKFVS